MPECETELEFNLSGRVKGLTPRATDTIDILNLDNKELIYTRKQLVYELIFTHGAFPEELQLLDDDLLQILMEEISQLEAFAPILDYP